MAASTGLNGRTGRVLTDFDHVLQSLDVIFGTRLGELVMLRWFGSGLPELLGRRITPRLVALYVSILALAIKTWEPRLDVVAVKAPNNSAEAVRLGELHFEVQVYYRPRGHLGDFTVEGGLRRIGVATDSGRITVAA